MQSARILLPNIGQRENQRANLLVTNKKETEATLNDERHSYAELLRGSSYVSDSQLHSFPSPPGAHGQSNTPQDSQKLQMVQISVDTATSGTCANDGIMEVPVRMLRPGLAFPVVQLVLPLIGENRNIIHAVLINTKNLEPDYTTAQELLTDVLAMKVPESKLTTKRRVLPKLKSIPSANFQAEKRPSFLLEELEEEIRPTPDPATQQIREADGLRQKMENEVVTAANSASGAARLTDYPKLESEIQNLKPQLKSCTTNIAEVAMKQDRDRCDNKENFASLKRDQRENQRANLLRTNKNKNETEETLNALRIASADSIRRIAELEAATTVNPQNRCVDQPHDSSSDEEYNDEVDGEENRRVLNLQQIVARLPNEENRAGWDGGPDDQMVVRSIMLAIVLVAIHAITAVFNEYNRQ